MVAAGERQWGYGVVVSVLRKAAQDRVGVPESAAAAYLVDTLLCVAGSGGDIKKDQERKREAQGAPQPAALTAANAEMQVRLPGACCWVCLLPRRDFYYRCLATAVLAVPVLRSPIHRPLCRW